MTDTGNYARKTSGTQGAEVNVRLIMRNYKSTAMLTS